jgi:type I restriction enzyme S subunit
MGNTPNIRFKGFTDDWEQRKLGTLCSLITKGTTPKDKSGNGEVNFVKVENIDTDNGEVTSMSKISVEEHEGYLKRSRLEENDILFSIAGTLGRVSVVKPSILPANTNQALAIIRTNEGYIPYLTTVLKGPAVEDFIRRNPTIGAQPNLSLEQVNNLDISYPEYDEQVKIGDYFALLDNLITLHQRKCDETKKLKKYMLQKMFPQKNEKKPEIRFAGFTDDWEQRKLGDIITEYKETVDSDCTLPILTSSKTEGVILQEEHFGRKQQHDITGYNILPRNYCTYRNRSDGVDFTFNINKCCDKGIISKFYPVFSGKNSDVFFLSLVLNNSEEVVREIAYTCTGTGQKVLSFLDLQKMKVRVPNFDEQKEIAAYFESLDHIITLHQRKCDEIKEVKKFMLQNMFPQKG